MTKIAAVQLNSSSNVEQNLQKVEKYVKEAKSLQAQLVVLPEDFSFIGKEEKDKVKNGELFKEGYIQKFLSNLAKINNIWILGGSIPILPDHSSKKIYNSSLLYDNEGELKARYDKIHLFDVKIKSGRENYNESKFANPGKEIVCVKSPFGKLGLSICYDLRFPELYRALVQKGAKILFVPAAFTKFTGRAHWEILLRARAVENFCYVVAANQTGMHDNNKETYGHSMIINPWGEIIAEIKEEEGIITADITLEELTKVRESIPALNNMRELPIVKN